MKKPLALLLALLFVFCLSSAFAAVQQCAVHSWGEWQNDYNVNVVCGMAQPLYRVCVQCGATELGSGAVRNHEYPDGGWTVSREASCTDFGTMVNYCMYCQNQTEQSISPLGHDFGGWETSIESGCESEGFQISTCSRCGLVQGSSLPAIGHSYGPFATIREATQDAAGIKARTCSNCGNREDVYYYADGVLHEGMYDDP